MMACILFQLFDLSLNLDMRHAMSVEILYWNKKKIEQHVITPNGCLIAYKPLGVDGELLQGFIREKVAINKNTLYISLNFYDLQCFHIL